MATGFESYVTLMDTDPTTALSQARQHLAALMAKQGARVGDAGASYDPSTLQTAIDTVREDIQTLRAQTVGIGVPQFVPCRRAD
jgi:hypothetical protein